MAEINDNPDYFAENASIEDLEKVIQKAAAAYYNDGNSDLSDNSYDALVWHLTKRYKAERKNAQQKLVVGAPAKTNLRAELPYLMPSLDKVKIGNGGGLRKFLDETTKLGHELIVSHKLDGVSGMIVYEDGIPQSAYLRGDGVTGGDVSYVLDHISLPELSEGVDLVVRGEFVMSHEAWKSVHTSKSVGARRTSRNFVCGKLNAGHPSPDLQLIDFVAFELVIDGVKPSKPHADGLQLLEKYGFNIVKYTRCSEILVAELVNLYEREYKEGYYPIDGMVLTRNIAVELPDTLANPTHAVAFKINLEEQLRTTTVTAIHWQISRHGRMVPVIEYKNVYIDGRKLHRATGTHAKRVLNEYKIGIDSVIEVTASGGVIPKVTKVIKAVGKPVEPPTTYPWKWQGCNIVLCDPDSCPEVIQKRSVHFFETLRVPRLRDGMVAKLYQDGLKTIQDIIGANKARLMKVSGIGVKTSDTYISAISNALAHANLYHLMIASPCFPSGMGKTFLRQIATSIPTFLSEKEASLRTRLLKLPGIGPKRSSDFIEGWKKFKIFLQDFKQVEENNERYYRELAEKGYNKSIDGKEFVFTELDDDTLEDYILDHRGSIKKAVTKSICAVVTGNPACATVKRKDAANLGIKVYTVAEFKKTFNIIL